MRALRFYIHIEKGFKILIDYIYIYIIIKILQSQKE
jgi:hypothetical protein